MSRATPLLPSLLLLAAPLVAAEASAAPHAEHGPYGAHGPQPEMGLQLPDGTVARPNFDLGGRMPPAAARAWDRFRLAHDQGPGAWRALWNQDTGVPSRVYGGYIEVPGVVADADRAVQVARDALLNHLDLFAPGSEPGDFVLAGNHLTHDGAYRTVGFEQIHRGMPVLGGQVSVRIKNDRVFMLASEARPRVDVAAPELIVPADELQRRAEAWIHAERGGDPTARADIDGPLVLPILTDLGLRYEAAVKVVVDLPEPFEEWHVFLDPETGREIAREQKLLYATGTVNFDVVDRYPDQGRIVLPASNLTLRVSTGNTTADITTDALGELTWSGTDDAALSNPPQPAINVQGGTITSGFSGPEVRVADLTRATNTLDGTLAPDGSVTLGSPSNQFLDANFNTFLAMQTFRNRVLEIDPGNSWLSSNRLLAFTNVNNLCNAVANGQFILLFRGGTTDDGSFCENTGRIDDVVYHELGHTVHANSVIPGVGDFVADYSEGLSDYVAATITDDPGMARGFFGSSAPLRQLDPRTPNTWSRVGGSIRQHTRGLAYAGAQWDLRTALIAKLGPEAGIDEADRLWFETLRRASGILTTFAETIAANDDDGDLSNGTPDFCDIQDAFGTHELAVGEGFSLSFGAVAIDGLDVSVPVERPVIECGLPSQEVASGELRYRIDGGAEQTVPLQEGEDAWTGSIPSDGLTPGSLISFSVEIARGDGTSDALPRNPASPSYEIFYGTVDPLLCSDFETNPFADAGFTSEGFSAPNDWQWAASVPAVDGGTAFSGSGVVGNTLVGEGRYPRGAINRMSLPPVDVDGYERVFLQYRRHLSVFDRFFSRFGRRFDQASIVANDIVAWESGVGSFGEDFVDEEWRFHSVDLTDAVRQGELVVGFELASSDAIRVGTRGGWTIDDLCVAGFNPPSCGNGEVEIPEVCDDGNTVDFDGCQADCTLSPEPECGNGIVEAGEVCDDGNEVDGDGCESTCVETPPAVCGNGTVEGDEICDDGNQTDGDGCQADCTLTPEAVCGNGVVETGEACDDGNTENGDDCTSSCTIPEPEEPEEPEDPPGGGLTAADDGCVCVGGQPVGTPASLLVLGALGALVLTRRRRDRI